MPGRRSHAPAADSRGHAESAPPPNEAHGQRKSTAFELFILGELVDAPHHGYLLRDILARMLGPYRQISWGAIYPLIHHLEREGFIAFEGAGEPEHEPEHEPERLAATRTGRRRRRFHITEAGRQRFYALMLTLDEYIADFREIFTIKLLYQQFLTPPQQEAFLAHGQDYFKRQCEHSQEVFTARSPSAHLPAEAREHIFRMMRFRLASAEAELDWVERELARVREQLGKARAVALPPVGAPREPKHESQ